MFSDLLSILNEPEERKAVAAVVGLKFASIVKNVIPDCPMIWEYLENEKPRNCIELMTTIKSHCKKIVAITYGMTHSRNELISAKRFYMKA